ncbi:hypothetical protein SAMN05421753_103292 [Planctomicrobium piriforme]|uniref:Uncharacterized protein n=1 Tax=Planctomicrobium piriforme TaxID=1576369 RepID=A0A1I3DKC5_9PLAN|nr:hypothetical protein SAMN05421753_103292 [Planctomicrobium piriforme]
MSPSSDFSGEARDADDGFRISGAFLNQENWGRQPTYRFSKIVLAPIPGKCGGVWTPNLHEGLNFNAARTLCFHAIPPRISGRIHPAALFLRPA